MKLQKDLVGPYSHKRKKKGDERPKLLNTDFIFKEPYLHLNSGELTGCYLALLNQLPPKSLGLTQSLG